MAWWTALIGPTIKAVTKVIDEVHTSDEERLNAKMKLLEIQNTAEQKAAEMEHKFEEELTKRHAADMAGSAWLPKNIRPLSLVFLLVVVAVLSVADGFGVGFEVKQDYIQLYESLLLLAFGFYFGSRGLEKIAGIISTMKGKK